MPVFLPQRDLTFARGVPPNFRNNSRNYLEKSGRGLEKAGNKPCRLQAVEIRDCILHTVGMCRDVVEFMTIRMHKAATPWHLFGSFLEMKDFAKILWLAATPHSSG